MSFHTTNNKLYSPQPSSSPSCPLILPNQIHSLNNNNNNHFHNLNHFNYSHLPPTPPRSLASSPPLSAPFISLSSNALPSPRLIHPISHPPLPTTNSFHSLSINPSSDSCPAHPYPSDSSSWDGTLSAALFGWLALLRDHVLPPPPPGLLHPSLLSSPSPLPPALRSLVAAPLFGLSPSALRFGLLCALWYSASALSSNTGKTILTRFRYPVTLTIVQFAFVAAWSGLILLLRARTRAPTARLPATRPTPIGIRRPSKATMRGTCVMSVFSIAGHVFSSMAIARVPVSTVHTIKALSPLFTVVAYAGLFGVRYGMRTYLSLLPLTLGVMLACSFDMRANGVGFLCALGSTVVFVSQNIFGKKMLPRETSEGGSGLSKTGMDKLTLLFYSSAVAFVLMVPIWAWTDAWSLVVSGPAVPVDSLATLVLSFLCNGSVHFLQCILAFSILARTSPVTYSIASLVKRIAVICLAIVWFGQPVSPSQAAGMLLTFGGLWVYNQAKPEIARGERRRGKVERRMEVLLPSTAADAVVLGEEDQDEQSEPLTPRRVSLPTHTAPSSICQAQASNVTGNKTRHRAPSLSAGILVPGLVGNHSNSSSKQQNLKQAGQQSYKSIAVR